MEIKRLEQITIPLIFLLISAMGWFVSRMDTQIYQIQTSYVSQQHLAESLRSIEKAIATNNQALEMQKKTEFAIFSGWLQRIEKQQEVLAEDIKKILGKEK